MKYAKLYDTDLGQILVKIDSGESTAAEVRFYFTPTGLGVCSVAYSWADKDENTQWDKAEEYFEDVTEESAIKIVKGILDKLDLSETFS